jgi:signal recognition particle receptor subunit beta
LQNTQGIIWVVDSNDRERIDEYRTELWKMLAEDELRDVCVLVFANKQDIPSAMSPKEVADKLELQQLKSHPWFLQGCVGTTGDGLYEGFNWLIKEMQKKQ